MEEEKNAQGIFVGKTEGKRTLERLGYRWMIY
jgi:hypothetical protein